MSIDITEKCAVLSEEIYNILGNGRRETIYQNALAYELTTNGYTCSTEITKSVKYKGCDVGHVRYDIVIYETQTYGSEMACIVECKAVAKSSDSLKNQARAYYRDTGCPVFFVNFGHQKVEYEVIDSDK